MNALATVAAWDLVAEGYAEANTEFFASFNDAALDLVAPTKHDRVLDVGCGPGTLAMVAAGKVASIDALDFSEKMISILRRRIDERGLTNVTALMGDGQNLPHPDGTFDATFSMFGLMFFPDRAKGLAEIHRTLKKGGRACISSWAPVDQSPLMQVMFDALRAINPGFPKPQTDINSLENPDRLAAELANVGLKGGKIHKVTRGLEFTSAWNLWDTLTKGSAPVLMMRKKVGESVWREKSKMAVNHIEEAVGAFPATLSADAWIGVANK
jgi:ubiquinone/menaquinone biosynthesis C-methylase UbiE